MARVRGAAAKTTGWAMGVVVNFKVVDPRALNDAVKHLLATEATKARLVAAVAADLPGFGWGA